MQLIGPLASRAFRCYWALEELQLDYQYSTFEIASGKLRTPEFLKINPNGKVPAR
jgi:glutathione S-transferase